MVKRAHVIAALASLATAVGAAAAPGRFSVHADLLPTGCTQTAASTAIEIAGCVASGTFAGAGGGTIDLRYGAKVDIAKNGGVQQGTLTLRGATAKDTLVVRLTGRVTISTGVSRGTWKAVARTGAFAKTAPPRGTYASRTPDQGVHVSFDVRG